MQLLLSLNVHYHNRFVELHSDLQVPGPRSHPLLAVIRRNVTLSLTRCTPPTEIHFKRLTYQLKNSLLVLQ
jgi:hypothetical protein